MAEFTPTFKPFIDGTDVSPNQKEVVTAPLWSKSQASLFSIFTSSAQSVNQKRYYYEVFNSQSSVQGAEAQFSVAYGDLVGSGSSTGSADQNLYDYPTKAVYTQYRQLLLPTNQTAFTFENGETSEYVYVVNVNRARFKDKIDTKSWQLSIGKLKLQPKIKYFNPDGKLSIGLLNLEPDTNVKLITLFGKLSIC